MVGVLFSLKAALFAYGLGVGSAGLQGLGAVCLVGGAAVLAVKLGKEVRLATKWDIVGDAEVVNEVSEGRKGTVRVGPELWTCKSDARLTHGSEVRVDRVRELVGVFERPDEGAVPLGD